VENGHSFDILNLMNRICGGINYEEDPIYTIPDAGDISISISFGSRVRLDIKFKKWNKPPASRDADTRQNPLRIKDISSYIPNFCTVIFLKHFCNYA